MGGSSVYCTPLSFSTYDDSAGGISAGRCMIDWRARGDNRITVTAWTAERTLAPGERLTLSASYELV